MGKYDLGEARRKVNEEVKDSKLSINKAKVDYLTGHVDSQLDIIRNSLLNINNIMNQIINKKVVATSRLDVIRGWSRKCKSQAKEAEKLKGNLSGYYIGALEKSSNIILDDYIDEIQKKLEAIIKE